MEKGKIAQVMGPVVDVAFDNYLPVINEALKVTDDDGQQRVMEVSKHMGNHVVRCILLDGSEGLSRGMEVEATGSCIKVPVGDQTLGRMFNVLGDAIDGGEQIAPDKERWDCLLYTSDAADEL